MHACGTTQCNLSDDSNVRVLSFATGRDCMRCIALNSTAQATNSVALLAAAIVQVCSRIQSGRPHASIEFCFDHHMHHFTVERAMGSAMEMICEKHKRIAGKAIGAMPGTVDKACPCIATCTTYITHIETVDRRTHTSERVWQDFVSLGDPPAFGVAFPPASAPSGMLCVMSTVQCMRLIGSFIFGWKPSAVASINYRISAS